MAALLAGIYFLLIGHSDLAPEARGAEKLPAELDARLRCDPALPLRVELGDAIDADGRGVVRGKISFRRAGDEVLRWVSFDYYRARAGDKRGAENRQPAVVISPITGGGYEVSRLLANDLATHGYHAVIVKRPGDGKALQAQVGLQEFETAMRNETAARRRVIDWLMTRDEVDPRRIGAYGVSLGGVLTAALAAVDDRVVAAVVVMGCGDLPALLSQSVEPEPRQIARANGVSANPTPTELRAFEELARPILKTDPTLLARYADPREIFMVITRRDKSVPTVLQQRLRDALGGPETLSLPTGHYATIAYLPIITAKARGFLARRFAEVTD